MFSRNLGLMFTGVAIGPVLGGLLIRFTGTFIIVFYISAIIHIIYALLVWFVIPESLSKADMLGARARYKLAKEEYFAAHAHGGALVFFKRMFSFLTPLAIFLPVRVDGGKPSKGRKRDWNLLLVVMSYGFVISLLGLYLYVIQYLEATYEWNAEQVGYWFSSVGAARAAFLTLILPMVIQFFKPKAAPIRLPQDADEPLASPTDASFPAEQPSRVLSPPSHREHHHHHDPNFDLNVAKVSVGIEVLVYTLMVFSTSGLMFAGVATLGAFGMGFGPAIQSIALTLYNRRGGKDSGKLFGAMSVVQSLSSGVLGPSVFGLTYMNTVSTYPKAIFIMGCGAVTTSFLLLQLVRLPKDAPVARSVEDVDLEDRLIAEPGGFGVEREDTLVGPSEPLVIVDDGDRGHKVVKTLP
ncbi:hypothetical protein GSI_13970 [Ganoderma sinense ZZ0214-1]|uniref:Major facilitator superfamily (MFS) profile domain-containing protein n=1 Tax=Ganoderma sinense ZZ0214-1 TaxID=1077348 RepID=A0A2G8RRS6_9APHY|nr:hypothetical protein GSI_13970 [Ganoderma sinense ZZ0214-1]